MNEQELIIQGNQASVLMPKLKRYIDEQIAALSAGVASKVYVDEQIAALAEKDKDTLFINFSEVSSSEKQTILFIAEESNFAQVYTDAEIPEDASLPPEIGSIGSIARGIYDKYHESYPWLERDDFANAKKVVDGYIVLKPVDEEEEPSRPEETPWLRLGYSTHMDETDAIEQHLGLIRRYIGGDYSDEREDLFTSGFLVSRTIPFREITNTGPGKTFVLKGWMLLKNS